MENNNTSITYFFPKEEELEAVMVNSPHVPSVGDRISISSLELTPESPRLNYYKHRHWRVRERVFCCRVPTTQKNRLVTGTHQSVEIYLERTAFRWDG
jgi:hypothetical protein